jgi:membrane protein YfhO
MSRDDDAQRSGSTRASMLAAVSLLALAVAPFWKAVAGYGVLFRRDIGMVWYPLVASFVRCAADGSWPLWDAYRGFGQPLLADPRAEVLYPPTWLTLAMSAGTYYTLFVVAHVAFSGLGLYLLARRWRLSPLGSFGAAAAWVLSGPFVSLASMWHHLAGAAWIPWIFWAAEGALERSGVRPLVGLALAVAAQVLAGSPDYSLLTILALAVYVGSRCWSRPPSWRAGVQVALRLGFAAALALLASAAQWLPTLEWALRSERRSLPFEEAAVWSLHPASVVEALLPFRWYAVPLRSDLLSSLLEGRDPWLVSIYLGATVFALAALGTFVSGRERRGFLVGLALASTLAALGKHTFLFAASRLVLPPLALLRFPVKAMVLTGFATALLAGLGIEALAAAPPTRVGGALRGRGAALAVGLVAVGAWVLALTHGGWATEFLSGPAMARGDAFAASVTDLGRAAALVGGILVLVWASGSMSAAWLGRGAAALLCLDLLTAHAELHPVAPAALFVHRPEALDSLATSPGARLYVDDYSVLTPSQRDHGSRLAGSYRLARAPKGWAPEAALALGVQMYLNPPTAARWGRPGSYDADILGFSPPELSRLVDLLRASEGTTLHLRLLRMGAVTDVVSLQPAPWWGELRPKATLPGLFELPIRVFDVPDPLPRAYVVAGVRSASGAAAFEALADPTFDPTREAVLDASPIDGDEGGSVRIVELRSDRVVLEAQLPQEGHVVLVDAFDPGWRALVDGAEARILRANVAFMAVAAPPGVHRVEFRYRPPSVRLGLILSATGLVLASVASAASLAGGAGRVRP